MTIKVYGPDEFGMINLQMDEGDWKVIQDRLAWLDALEKAGVDNWEGISYVHELYDGPGDK